MSARVAADFLDAWARAHTGRDVEGLVSLYTPDALFFGSVPELAQGHIGIRQYFEQLAPHDDATVGFEVLATRAVTDTVMELASLGTFRWRDNPGTRIRFTHTLVELDGSWRAISHHASTA